MLQFKKKLLSAMLVAVMVLPLSQGIVWSDNETIDIQAQAEDTAEAAENTEAAETAPTAQEALALMRKCAENTNLILYVNDETGNFALENKKNGFIWWSSPYDAEFDPLAKGSQKNDLMSTMIFNIGNVDDQRATKTTIYETSAKSKKFKLEDINGGFKITYKASKYNLSIPLEVTIVDDYMLVNLITKDITEEKVSSEDITGYVLVDLSLIPNFGAAGVNETGYMIVPDGSGAVINFNNQKGNYKEYTGKVYGRDLAVSQTMRPAKVKDVNLPVIGIVKEDNAMMAVVEEGDSYASVRANVSGQKSTSFNNVYFNFQLRSTDNFMLGNTNNSLTVFERGDIKIDNVKIRYYPLEGKGIDYNTVAQRYSKYLTDEMNVTKKTQADNLPLYVDMYGGVMKQQSILGIPVNTQMPATTFKQAQEILSGLVGYGVDSMIVKYNDYSNSGIKDQIQTSADFSSKLGGKTEFNKLNEYLEANGAKLFPSVELMEYYKSGNGYSVTSNSSVRVTKAYARQVAYEYAFGIPHQNKKSWSILSPSYFENLYQKLASSFNKAGIKNLSVGSGAVTLYSDFGKRNISREVAKNNLIKSYETAKANVDYLMSEGANAYALPYVDYISDVPMYSSNFDLFDYDIPFYSLVIHGLIPYSSGAINSYADANAILLRSIVTGSSVRYDFAYSEVKEFQDTNYDVLFYANYKGWLEDAANNYKLTSDTIKSVADKKITKYEILSEDELQSTFEDGTVIKVNLKTLDITVNGTVKNLADYGLNLADAFGGDNVE